MTNDAIQLTVLCSLLSVLFNIPWGLTWGYVLARKNFPGKVLVHALLYAPLVLPPVLTGYFLLKVFSPLGFFGGFLKDVFGLSFVLDWKGVVIATTVVSSPFMIQFVKEGFGRIDQKLEWAAKNLGASRWKIFWTILFPLAAPSFVAGAAITFAKSVGEFGATIIFAGNMAGETQTIPLAIYQSIFLGRTENLFILVMAAMILSYGALALHYWVTRDRHD